MRFKFRYLLLLAALVWPATSTGAHAADASIEEFYGDYEGQSISETGEGLSKRDLAVSIKPDEDKKKGFVVDWTTVTQKSGGETNRKSYSIKFRPTKRPNIYGSAMRPNLFGKTVPLDPLQGEPYVWAKLEVRTLTVYAMLITDDGSYEMQVYHRILTDNGMDLKFRRFREDGALKQIDGKLKKVGG